MLDAETILHTRVRIKDTVWIGLVWKLKSPPRLEGIEGKISSFPPRPRSVPSETSARNGSGLEWLINLYYLDS
jgi:hypothetical protein